MSKKPQPVLTYWNKAKSLPFGKSIYRLLVNNYIPYTGSIKSKIEVLEPGYARISLKQRRYIQNHLRSIHALAIANLGEFAGNLAVFAGMPGDARLIVKGFNIEYLKKSKGTITAESKTPILETNERKEIEVYIEIKDEEGDIVAKMKMDTLVGPTKN